MAARFAMKLRILLILLAGAVLGAGGFWWWRAGGQAQIVAAALPPVPDLSGALPVLRRHILEANARARHRLTAVRGLEELARLYQANGYLDAAMRCDEGLEVLEPNEPRWFHYDATILGGYGEIAHAEKLWRRVIQLAPDYVPARLRLGGCLIKTDQLGKARATYEAVLKIRPNDPYAKLNLARIDMEEKRWDEARPLLEAVVQESHYELGYDLIVTLYDHLGLTGRADAIRGAAKASGAYHDFPDPWMNELMDACYDPYRLGLLAGVAAHSGDSVRAFRLLKRAIALKPDDVSTHFQLAGLAETTGNTKLAIDEYRNCTRLKPDFSDGWAHLSFLQAKLGEKDEADRTLAEGLAHCPNSPGLHLMRARRLRDAGRNSEAISEFETSIHLRPNAPDAYTELGSLYIEQGQVAAGIREMRLALEADPGDPLALGVMAFHAISTNDQAGAQRWMARVTDQPRMPHAQLERLLDAYRQTFGRDWKPEQSQ